MEFIDVVEVGREAIFVLLKTSLPLLLVALGLGLVISLFQALTQIQEQTLTFVPKLVVVLVALIFVMPYIATTLMTFTELIADRIIAIGS